MMKRSTPSTWKVVKLGGLVSFKTGKLDSNAATVNGAYPFFTCAQETYRTDTCAFDCECVLLAGNNAAGIFPLKYFKGKFDAYQRTYIIRSTDNGELANRFLYFALRPKLEHLKSISTGAATKFLTLGLLKGLDIEIPPLETQHKIASILSTYDNLIENNTRRIKILEEMAQAIYREWFVNFRFPGHEKVKMVGSSLGEIPEGWGVKPLGEVYKTGSGGTPSRKKNEYYGGEIPWVKTKELKDGFVLNSEETITALGLKKSSAKLFPNDSVVIAMYGATIGKLGILTQESTTNQACCALIPQNELFGPEYIYWYLLNGRQELISLGQGAAQQNISQTVIKGFEILVPGSSVMTTFNTVSKSILDQIKNLCQKNQNLRQTRDLLLPKLISGEVDASALEIEVKETAA